MRWVCWLVRFRLDRVLDTTVGYGWVHSRARSNTTVKPTKPTNQPNTPSAQNSARNGLLGPLSIIQSRLLDLGAAIATPAKARVFVFACFVDVMCMCMCGCCISDVHC